MIKLKVRSNDIIGRREKGIQRNRCRLNVAGRQIPTPPVENRNIRGVNQRAVKYNLRLGGGGAIEFAAEGIFQTGGYGGEVEG